MRSALHRRSTQERAANGGVAARRAVLRWGWRLFRREWRQQLLVLLLLTITVAAAIFSVTAVYNIIPSSDAGSARPTIASTSTGPIHPRWTPRSRRSARGSAPPR